MKHYYIYKGPVKMFDDIIDSDWSASTVAKTYKQALNNLTYRYKKEHKYSINTKITLNSEYLQKMHDIPYKKDYEYYDSKMEAMINECNAKNSGKQY